MIRDRSLIEAAARETEAELRRIDSRIDPAFREEFQNYTHHFTIFRAAPVVIVPLFRPVTGLTALLVQDAPVDLLERLRRMERHAAMMSVAMAIQNLLLAAESADLGACCVTAPLLAAAGLSDLLEIPDGWEIAALVAVGWPAESPPDPGRKPVQSIVLRK